MSQTFSLVCQATRQKIWVGQGWMTMGQFYAGDAATMRRLGRFLEATRGHLLILVCNDTDGANTGDYEEFEEPLEDA